MSHRVLNLDPIAKRKREYRQIESDQMEAIMEAFEMLREQKINLGGKMDSILKKRAEIKRRNPK